MHKLIVVTVTVALSLLFSAAALAAPARGEDNRPREGTLKEGEAAPDFELKYEAKDKKESVKLSSFAGEQPVVLVFGSYT